MMKINKKTRQQAVTAIRTILRGAKALAAAERVLEGEPSAKQRKRSGKSKKSEAEA